MGTISFLEVLVMARPYPPEFRKEAVELYLSTDRPRSHVAESLGISSESLRRWTEQYQVDRGVTVMA